MRTVSANKNPSEDKDMINLKTIWYIKNVIMQIWHTEKILNNNKLLIGKGKYNL